MADISVVTVCENAVVFRFGSTECRLTFADPEHCAWRLKTGGEPFDETGASQSLALFLGERAPEDMFPVRAEKDGQVFRVRAECGAQVLLGPDRLTFLTPNGRVAAVLSGIAEEKEKTVVSGRLEDGEAVYGCGERFNCLNMRGKTVDMFTCDGWNNSFTTYVAIPFFCTSRGAGVFINRYERMIFDFGGKRPDVWDVCLLHAHADMYIFASGKIAGAIDGYMELSGRPAKVYDWFSGPVVCRYSPDFRLLKGKTVAVRSKAVREIVTADGESVMADVYFVGDGVVDIVRRFCDMDAKPQAVIIEAWSAKGVFSPDDLSASVVIAARGADNELLYADAGKVDLVTETVPATNANKKQALKDCAEYLHSLGIRMMMYAPVGGCCLSEKNVPGRKEEYLLHIRMDSDDPAFCHDSFTGAPWMVCADTANVDVGGGNASGARTEKGIMLDMSRRFDYLDITDDEAWDWYIDTVWKELIGLGVDGVKIDFCEVLPDSGSRYFIRGTDAAAEITLLWKHPEKLYGTLGCEHHAYASLFISKFLRDVSKLKKDGFMLLSRGGGIGSQRNPYMWAGDQCRSFDKLDDQLFAVLNSGLSGLPYMTYDCGGYHYAKPDGIPLGIEKGADGKTRLLASYCPSAEDECRGVEDETCIFMRAVEFTVFSANVQTHGDVRHAYEMTEEGRSIYALYMKLHVLLRDYIMHCAAITAEKGLPISRHMFLEFGDDAVCRGLEDQYMFGSALLVAPVFRKGGGSRRVYLPRGNWRDLRSGNVFTGGAYTEAAYDERSIPVFLRTDDADTAALVMLEKVFGDDIWKAVLSGKTGLSG